MELNQAFIQFLESLGVMHYFGCNGGGMIQYLKHLSNHHTAQQGPQFKYISEYVAGFAPIGHYLACGEIACSIVTTGAAEKLVASGASDARFMGIPAVYLMALSSERNLDNYPIQDVSAHGMNIVEQFRAEFNDSVVYIHSECDWQNIAHQIQETLRLRQPVMIFFHPNFLSTSTATAIHPYPEPQATTDSENIQKLIHTLKEKNTSRRVIVLPCTESAVANVCPKIFQDFVEKIHAQVIYPVNGDNTAIHTKKQNLGHILLGGNASAIHAWRNLNEKDILITLGVDVGEYMLDLGKFPNCKSFCISAHQRGYGQINQSYTHQFIGDHTEINADIEKTLQQFLRTTQNQTFQENMLFPNHHDKAPTSASTRDDCVNIVEFYNKMDNLWQPNSIAFEDVCIAYRDRQAIIKQPNENVKIFTSHHGSAMGGAFGLGIGAAVADGHRPIFIFSGDGCFRLFGGNLMEAAQLNLVLFIMNNGELSIVRDGCNHILKKSTQKSDHSDIDQINWEHIAGAFGWRYFKIHPDLSNLETVMSAAYDENPTSILVNLPLDAKQVIGKNFRYDQITRDSNL